MVVTLITAAGNVVNDVYDLEIDRISRPDRPLPAGLITLSGAKAYAAVLFLGGLAAAALTTTLCFAIALVNSIILVGYAVWLKRTPGIGNVAVAYLTASVFLFGGAFEGIEGLIQNLSLATITFLATIAREILKDAEDVDGDAAGGARTLPMLVGVQWTGRRALACACGAVLVSILLRRLVGSLLSYRHRDRRYRHPWGGGERGARRRHVSARQGLHRSYGPECLLHSRSLRLLRSSKFRQRFSAYQWAERVRIFRSAGMNLLRSLSPVL